MGEQSVRVQPPKARTDTIAGRFRVQRRIGQGSFGRVYSTVDLETKREVAVKVEDATVAFPQLSYESRVLSQLANKKGFTQVYYYGTEGNWNILAIDLLGPSLEDVFTKLGQRFSLKAVLQIADQALERIELLHSLGWVNRDIKPDNLCLGRAKKHTIYMIDFGLSKRVINPISGAHIPYRDDKSLTGTARYASINAHLGIEQSRRDDVEAIGHMLLYFYLGQLPWQGLPGDRKSSKYRRICEKKRLTPLPELCKGMPEEFANYMKYARALGFTQKPDYQMLRDQFAQLYQAQGYGSLKNCQLEVVHLLEKRYAARHSQRTTEDPRNAAFAGGTPEERAAREKARERQQPQVPTTKAPDDGRVFTPAVPPQDGERTEPAGIAALCCGRKAKVIPAQ